jgi:hypothetical protein
MGEWEEMKRGNKTDCEIKRKILHRENENCTVGHEVKDRYYL